MPEHESLLQAHYERLWQAPATRIRLSEGPLWELPEAYCVLKFAPQAKSGSARVWRFATCGMSQPGDPSPLELLIESPIDSLRIVELLNMTAHFHRTGESLGLGHTVNFGSPWLPGSQCEFGLVSLPYLDGPALERASVAGADVRILWLLPITRAEREFKKRFGAQLLEQAFEKAQLNYLDPSRKSVV